MPDLRNTNASPSGATTETADAARVCALNDVRQMCRAFSHPSFSIPSTAVNVNGAGDYSATPLFGNL